VRIVEAAAGKDITDHVNAGHALDAVTVTWESEPANNAPDLAPDIWRFIESGDDGHDWLIPGLLERRERLIVTGTEGNGKTTLLRQLAVTAGAGVDPFRPLTRPTYPPCRVLWVDCENNERQSRRRFRPLAQESINAGRRVPDGGLRLIHRPEGIDLTRDDYAAWLLERVRAHQPDLIVIGSLYKLHAADINAEVPARRVISVLDQARATTDCTLIIEAHSGHTLNGEGQRQVRPAGSSVFLRWPEYGFGLRGTGDADQWGRFHEVEVVHWRGGRDERDWPHALSWAERGWPWQIPLAQAALSVVK
jgi:RecA-family ATPase